MSDLAVMLAYAAGNIGMFAFMKGHKWAAFVPGMAGLICGLILSLHS